MKKKITELLNRNTESEEERMHVQYILGLGILTFACIFMLIFNLLTGYKKLAVIDAVFGLLCAFHSYLEIKAKDSNNISRSFFALELSIFMILFVIIGEPDGLSSLWILFIPVSGFFFFTLRFGTVVMILQLTSLMFLFWTPIGNSFLAYPYSRSFIERFPVIYTGFACLGLFLEIMRVLSRNDLQKSKDHYEYLYNHDALTDLPNRYGFNASLDTYLDERKDESFAFAIIDLDHFKNVNDTYGHLNGDTVLKEFANRIKEAVGKNGEVCRWGGEEFSILFYSAEKAEEIAQKILIQSRNEPVCLEDEFVITTFSMGLVLVRKGQQVSVRQLIRLADRGLYKAKGNGRNNVSCENYFDRHSLY